MLHKSSNKKVTIQNKCRNKNTEQRFQKQSGKIIQGFKANLLTSHSHNLLKNM